MKHFFNKLLSLLLAASVVFGIAAVNPVKAANTYVAVHSEEELAQALKTSKFIAVEASFAISGDYDIPYGTTLLLPFENNTGHSYTVNDNNHSHPYANSSADLNGNGIDSDDHAGGVIKGTKNVTLTINAGGSLNVLYGGLLVVGGQFTSSPGGYSGQPYGKYSELIICEGACVTVSGTLSAVGYITGSGELLVNRGSVYQPLVIGDYNGGTYTVVSFMSRGIAPFNIYAMINIQCPIVMDAASSMYGYCDMYTGSISAFGISIPAQHNFTTSKIIGSDNALLCLSGSGTIRIEYSQTPSGAPLQPFGKTTITLDTNASVGNLELIVNVPLFGAMSVNSSEACFAIPLNYDIVQRKGTLSVPKEISVKLMPGAQVTICEEAKLNVLGEVVVYDGSCTPRYATNFSGYSYPTKGALSNYGFSERARLIVNGEMTIQQNALFAGAVETQGSGLVNVYSTNLSTTVYEGVSKSDNYLGLISAAYDNLTSYKLQAKFVDHSQKYSSNPSCVNMMYAGVYYGVSSETIVTQNSYQSSRNGEYAKPPVLEGTWSTEKVLYDIWDMSSSPEVKYIDTKMPTNIPNGYISCCYLDPSYEVLMDDIPEQGIVYVRIELCHHDDAAFVSYTDNDDGTHTLSCTRCSTVLTQEHMMNDASTDDIHDITCGLCDYALVGEHNWLIETLGENGHRKTCQDCSKIITEEHTWNYEVIDEAQHKRYCTICSEIAIEAHGNVADCVCKWGKIEVLPEEDLVVIYGMADLAETDYLVVSCYDETGKMKSCDLVSFRTGPLSFDLSGLENDMVVKIFILDSSYSPKTDFILANTAK